MTEASRRWAVRFTAVATLALAIVAAGCSGPASAQINPSASSRASQAAAPAAQSPAGRSASGAAAQSVRPAASPTLPAAPTAIPTDVPTAVPTVVPTPVTPVKLGPAQFSLFTVNPQFTPQKVSFTLSRAAKVQIDILPTGATQPVRVLDLGTQAAGTVQASWDGRDNAGQLVPEGRYTYAIHAHDSLGTSAAASYSQLGITSKKMVVSLSQQRLTAYDGAKEFLTTLVTTGNPALPTPIGVYPILGKYHPFTFISPFPKGSKFYYAPSPVEYALLFDDSGYYVHDAPWRSVFGPGSNKQLGTPGENYTGSHGCVNVPAAIEQKLYAWSTIGTIVQVVP